MSNTKTKGETHTRLRKACLRNEHFACFLRSTPRRKTESSYFPAHRATQLLLLCELSVVFTV